MTVEREYKFLPALVSLMAGLVISVVILLNKEPSLSTILLVLGILLGFYCLGSIFRGCLIAFKTKHVEEASKEALEEDAQNDQKTE